MIINGWAHRLSGAAFKLLWYILRHTYGWQKDSDTISYLQFQHGIRKKERRKNGRRGRRMLIEKGSTREKSKSLKASLQKAGQY